MPKQAIVFVHGFMGRSAQFDTLRRTLSERVSADMHSIVLPGHEETLAGFTRSNEADWQRCVSRRLDELRTNYDRLLLIGHSMGGLLLINAAAARPDKIEGIIAISLLLRLKCSISGLVIRARSLYPAKARENQYVAAARAMNGVSGITLVNACRLIPNALGFLHIMKAARRALSALCMPLTAVQSASDETVSMKTIPVIRASCQGAQILLLKKASHFWFPKAETDQIADCICGALSAQKMP